MPALRKTSVSYGIDLTIPEFDDLLKWEDDNGIWPSVIHNALDAIEGVTMVEMNGHFGASIFVTVEAEHDTPETHKAILAATRSMIQQARSVKV